MQVEHVMDLHAYRMVLLIDADQSQSSVIRFYQVEEETSTSYTTHGMSPGQLLAVYRQMYDLQAPPTFMLAIRGYEFELGAPLSSRARENLIHAKKFLLQLLECENIEQWLKFATAQKQPTR